MNRRRNAETFNQYTPDIDRRLEADVTGWEFFAIRQPDALLSAFAIIVLTAHWTQGVAAARDAAQRVHGQAQGQSF